MMLGRTIRLAGGEDVSLIKPKWYTRIFVGADISTLIIQGLGTSYAAEHIAVLTTHRLGYHGHNAAQARTRW